MNAAWAWLRSGDGRWFAAVLALAFIVRLVTIIAIHPDPRDGRFDDSVFYDTAAQHIAAGDGYVFDPTILREYDIRGVFGETLSPTDAAALGRAFGSTLRRRGGRSVAVGYDGRVSSPELEAALVEGLASTGLEVKRIGLGPTPMLYFAVFHLPADGGVMVTGSHNPADYNGFKMMLGRESVHGEAIKRLGVQAGAVLNPSTSVHALEEVAGDVDYVLVMSVNPGFGGQRFIPASVDKIRRVRALLARRRARD